MTSRSLDYNIHKIGNDTPQVGDPNGRRRRAYKGTFVIIFYFYHLMRDNTGFVGSKTLVSSDDPPPPCHRSILRLTLRHSRWRICLEQGWLPFISYRLTSCAHLHPLFFVIRSSFLLPPYIPLIYKMYLGYFWLIPTVKNGPSVWFKNEKNWQIHIASANPVNDAELSTNPSRHDG
jgi:hypothetical protein